MSGTESKEPKEEHKAPEDMSDEEKIEHMEKLLDAMTPADKLKKPMEAMCKALEKFQAAMEKQLEADAKEAEKAEAAEAKAAEKQEKLDEKAEKAADKAKAKEEKAAPKEESKSEEPKKGNPFAKKDEAPKSEEKEASADPKLDAEKKDVALAEKAKDAAAELEKHEKAEVREMEAAASKSNRELQLEAELITLRAEKSMRAKAEFCKQVVSTMIDKRLVSAYEADVQKLTTDGTPLFDARAEAFKLAADRQHALLLKMDSTTLKAFAESIERIAKPAGTPVTSSYKMSSLPYTGSSDSDWLKSLCNEMGSQKGR
jgi:hypothetical protein